MNHKILIGSLIFCCVVVFGLIFWAELSQTQNNLVENTTPMYKKTVKPMEQTKPQENVAETDSASKMEADLNSMDLYGLDEGNAELEEESSGL